MQFSKISIKTPSFVIKYSTLDGRKICKCCGSRPVQGYVGNGTIIDDLCGKCYRANPEKREHARSPRFMNREGRS